MNYKHQKNYLNTKAFPEIKAAIITLRDDKKTIKGHYLNTAFVSDYIISNKGQFPVLGGKGVSHIHESAGTFLMEKAKGKPYNNRARTYGGRTYFIPGGVESIV